MKYPSLVPSWLCRTPIHLYIESEQLNEDGAPEIVDLGEMQCNYQDGGKALYTIDKKVIQITGRAYFDGEIYSGSITGGYAEIFGERRHIHRGFKRRNPDGTVNHTEVQFD
jgi:hypothetical protein